MQLRIYLREANNDYAVPYSTLVAVPATAGIGHVISGQNLVALRCQHQPVVIGKESRTWRKTRVARQLTVGDLTVLVSV